MVQVFLAVLMLSTYPLLVYGDSSGNPASWSPDGERIAYVRNSAPEHSIFVMDADGSNVEGLALGDEAVWSPDGTKIAYLGQIPFGDRDIFVMNADGSGKISLSNDKQDNAQPAWSPDGSRIAYGRCAPDCQVWVMDADGNHKTQLTSGLDASGLWNWSPDGSQIVFQRAEQIWVMDADGAKQTQLTSGPKRNSGPLWSPDGKLISYMQYSDVDGTLFVMKADGSDPVQVAAAGVSGLRDWSPDSSHIVYARNNEIWTVNEDGSGAVKIVTAEAGSQIMHIDWSSDGGQIAFEVNVAEPYYSNIYAVPADGGVPVNLTQSTRTNTRHRWSPDASRILFWSDREGNAEIWVSNEFGKRHTRIATFPSISDGNGPVWSPDGVRLAVAASQYSYWYGEDVYLVNGDGSGVTNLTNSAESEGHPAWSPNGKRIAYEREGDIWSMDATGGHPMRLTDAEVAEEHPAWSPDGKRIAYQRANPGSLGPGLRVDALWTMKADGSDQTPLTGYELYDYSGTAGFDWSPDGKRIVFSGVAYWSGSQSVQAVLANPAPPRRGIYRIDADGSGLTAVVDNSLDNRQPMWSPDGRRIAYIARGFPGGDQPAGLYVINLESGNRYRVAAEGQAAAWSPDGTKLVVNSA